MAGGGYIGLPITVNSLDMEEELVTEPDKVKGVSQEYWSKLYRQQKIPDVPKLWLETPSVLEVRERVK